MNTKPRIAFWGTPRFAVIILDELKDRGIIPDLIITAPPVAKGRGLEVQPSLVKVWADAHSIPTLEPTEIKSEEFANTLGTNWDLFIVAAYGKIIPRAILDTPHHSTLNVHPSLLPKLRGASPLTSGILSDVPIGSTHETGVTIMQIDEEVDHGPIVAQEKVLVPNWPPRGQDFEELMGKLGAKLLAQTIPEWLAGRIAPTAQDHDHATFTKKMTKGSAQIYLDDDPVRMYRKVRAFDSAPRAFFTTTRNGRDMRVIVTDAAFEDGRLVLKRVIPEGKKEMAYEDFLRGQRAE